MYMHAHSNLFIHVATVVNFCRHSNSKVRKTTSKFICASVENYGPSKLMHAHKDLLERTLVAVVQLTKDSVPEARYYARCCLNQLWPLPEFDPAVNRLLSDQMRRRAKEAVDNLKAKVWSLLLIIYTIMIVLFPGTCVCTGSSDMCTL